MSVTHCHCDSLMTQQFLYRVEVNTCINKPCSKCMPEIVEPEVLDLPDIFSALSLISHFKYIQFMLYCHQMTIKDKRAVNEKKFPNWEKLPNGDRRYWLEVKGKHGWKARYVKDVDAMEETVKFYQEIYVSRPR